MKTNLFDVRNYFPISHLLLEDPNFKKLQPNSQMLFIFLCRLRNRYGNRKDDMSFWRTDSQLISDTGFSRNQLKRARKGLIKAGFLWWASYLNEAKQFGPRYVLMDLLYQKPIELTGLSIMNTPDCPQWTPY